MALASYTGRKTFDPVPYVGVLSDLGVDVSTEAPDGLTIGVLVSPGAELPEPAPLDWEGLNSVGFEGENGQTVPLPVGEGSLLVLVGVGDSALTANGLRDAAAAFSRATLQNAEVGFILPEDFDPTEAAQVIVEGIILARYRYDALQEFSDCQARHVRHSGFSRSRSGDGRRGARGGSGRGDGDSPGSGEHTTGVAHRNADGRRGETSRR